MSKKVLSGFFRLPQNVLHQALNIRKGRRSCCIRVVDQMLCRHGRCDRQPAARMTVIIVVQAAEPLKRVIARVAGIYSALPCL